MSNLLPPESQKRTRKEFRARFLLAASLVLFCCAVIFALALTPAEVALVFFSPPSSQMAQAATSTAADGAALAHTKALLSAMQPFATSSSLTDISSALSEAGNGILIDDISYAPADNSLSLAGHAQTPDEVNALREALQGNPLFTNVSVPVSALLGSQDGSFTITMNLTN